jgi:hypothetical protein
MDLQTLGRTEAGKAFQALMRSTGPMNDKKLGRAKGVRTFSTSIPLTGSMGLSLLGRRQVNGAFRAFCLHPRACRYRWRRTERYHSLFSAVSSTRMACHPCGARDTERHKFEQVPNRKATEATV